MKGTTLMFLILLIPIAIASLWDKIPAIGQTVHYVLDPTLGYLFSLNINIGFLIAVAFFTLISILAQKYLTDQDTLKTIKEEQKILQAEMKLAKEHPEKQMELSKKSMELTMKAMPITMRPLIYTSLPFILTFRWFSEYFIAHPSKIFGLSSWLLAYIILSIVLSLVYKKIFKVQ